MDMCECITRWRLRCTFFWGVLAAVAFGAAGCSSDMSRSIENPFAAPTSTNQQWSASQHPPAPLQPVARTPAVERQPLLQAQSSQPQYAPSPAALQYEQPQYAASQYTPPQYAQPQYAPPQYAQPQYTPPQYTQPHSTPPQYAQPQYTPPQYAQPQYTPPQYAQPQPQYAQPQYTPPQYAQPQYTPPPYEPPAPRTTPDYTGAVRTGAKLAHAAAPRMPAPAQIATPMPTSMAGASAQTLLPAPPVHTVASGDTLGRIAHRYRVSVRDIAVANGIAPETPLKVGMRLTIPLKVAAMRPGKSQPGASVAAQTRQAAAPYANMPAVPAPGKLASSESAANVRIASPVEPSSEGVGPNGAPAFRWPARGRIINNFGAKVNGSTSDGIDLAVPEGTQVRAADDGVVAYAGSELKGYGNLVLVRHSNGFVTAYANASELLVRRNDQV